MFERETVIRVQRGLLLRIVAGLVAMLPEADTHTVTRSVRLVLFGILRPAEAAARRLIALLAHDMVVMPGASRALPAGGIPRGSGGRRPVFRLFDPRKHPGPVPVRKSAPGVGPRVTAIGLEKHVAAGPARPLLSDDPVDVRSARGRVLALRAALDDLPKQARRLARTFARGKTKWRRVMRPGRPPGYRHRGRRMVDEVLADCQYVALEALREPAVAYKPP